jgi:acetolactate synthase-1/2/3 large subunit
VISLTPRKHADQVCDWLVELGYTHCFFVAGGNIMHLLDGARTRFKCIPVVHEVSAGIAAEYFNESGAQGKAFALVTAGPGVSNIITAMGGAWLESRELLVLAGQVKSEDLATEGIRQRGIQEIDGVGLARPVAKVAFQVVEPISRDHLATLVHEGKTGRPGPVFLEFCLDVQGAPPIAHSTSGIVTPRENRTASPDEVSSVASLLASAQRPILLLGGGVSRDVMIKASHTLESAGIPCMTTWNGADRLDSSSRVYLGRPNTWGQRSANILLAQADVIIAIGTRLGLQQTGFNWQEFGKSAKVVQVDIDPAELRKGHPKVDHPVCADADDFLIRLIDQDHPTWDSWIQYAQRVRELLPLNDAANETRQGFISPYTFFEELSRLATSEDILIPCSSGGANSTAMQTIAQKSGQIIITDKGSASMGYGLAGAIGAALAWPNRRTFLFEGDGGFSQNLQELATVAVNQLPIKTFLFSNDGYGSIRMTQKNYFDGAYLGCDIETGLGFPDWHKLFGAYEIESVTIDENWSTSSHVMAMLKRDSPAAFIVPIDPLQTYWPKITSRVLPDGRMESNPLHQMSPNLSEDLLKQVGVYLT